MLGRWDEARDLATRLTRLDPLTGIYQFRLAITEWNIGNNGAAITAFERMRKLATQTSGNTLLELIDLIAEAHGIDEASRFLQQCNECQERYPGLARKLIESAKAQTALAPLPTLSSELEGANYLQLLIGGKDALLTSLERSTATGNLSVMAYNTKSIRTVRNTQRYKQLVIDAGLDRYWREHGWPSFCKPVSSSDFQCGETATKL